jgi:hypothetical protein
LTLVFSYMTADDGLAFGGLSLSTDSSKKIDLKWCGMRPMTAQDSA